MLLDYARSLLLGLLVALVLNNLLPASAADSVIPAAPLPGVEWTKIQDLNPQARAENRPIKQKWAVVVGAAKFKEKRLSEQSLETDQAAKEFYQYLVDPNGGRFEPSHVKLLINSAATRNGIIAALGEQFLGGVAGPDDLVVVFIATNGFPTTDGSTYLCAYDCALDNVYSTCISMQTLMETLRKNVKTDRIVLFLESRYSGAAELTSGSKGLFSLFNIDLNKIVMGKGYVIASSSQPNEITVNDSFSKNLVKALRQENGLISLQKAFSLAQQATEEDAQHSSPPRRQTPLLKSDWTGNELVLGAPGVEKAIEVPAGIQNYLSAEAHYLRATNLLAAGDTDGAIQEYKEASTIDPNYADALADYGAVLSLKGDDKAAAELYQRALHVRPNDSLYHANYARILSKLGREEESVQELLTAKKLDPKDKVVLSALANKALQAGNPVKAVELLNQAIELYPNSSMLQERLSFALAKSGDADGALKHAQQAVKLEPTSVHAMLNLGSILVMRGDQKQAIAAYREAEQLEPNNADTHFLLSKTLEAAGDKDGAQQELSRFVQLCATNDPRLSLAKEHMTELANSHQ